MDEMFFGPPFKGVFGAGVEGDPGAFAGRELFVGREEEGEGFGGGLGADGFGDFESTDDFVLGVVG